MRFLKLYLVGYFVLLLGAVYGIGLTIYAGRAR